MQIKHVETALRQLIREVDYDLAKQLEGDEMTGADYFPELAQEFCDLYGRAEAVAKVADGR